jgi:hypothetical protein
MRRLFKLLGLAMVITAVLVVAIASTAFADGGPMGPAPNSGDGIPDGSGFSVPNGSNTATGDCVPNDCSYDNDYNYLTPGPHGK